MTTNEAKNDPKNTLPHGVASEFDPANAIDTAHPPWFDWKSIDEKGVRSLKLWTPADGAYKNTIYATCESIDIRITENEGPGSFPRARMRALSALQCYRGAHVTKLDKKTGMKLIAQEAERVEVKPGELFTLDLKHNLRELLVGFAYLYNNAEKYTSFDASDLGLRIRAITQLEGKGERAGMIVFEAIANKPIALVGPAYRRALANPDTRALLTTIERLKTPGMMANGVVGGAPTLQSANA